MFLTEVGKHRVGTVLPDQFALLFNLAQNEVVTNKLALMDVNKKIQDDLNPLIRHLIVVMEQDTTEMHKCFTTERTEAIKRIKSIRALLNNTYNARCNFLPSARKSVLDNVYDKPTDKRVYYELGHLNSKSVIRVFTPITTTNVKLYVDYYTDPVWITAANVVLTSAYQFSNEMSIEIINVAARMCIEGNQDARYQTFLAEQQNRNVNQ
jgi:hypothetical protein